jgi:hypothetical protein
MLTYCHVWEVTKIPARRVDLLRLASPSVEATIQFASGQKGRLLVWRQGRLVYQDPGLRWWFG